MLEEEGGMEECALFRVLSGTDLVKRLEHPINIKRTDAAMAKAIISQFGGPDGETGAAMRYLSQRFAMPYRPVMGILTDIGTEASKYEFAGITDEKEKRSR